MVKRIDVINGSFSHRKKLLKILIVAQATLAVLCILMFALFPPQRAVPTMDHSIGDGNAAPKLRNTNASSNPMLQAYTTTLERHLRRPLYDPEPIVQETPPPPKPVLQARLLGTVLEPGFTYAIFRDASGEQKFVSAGQSIEGAEIMSIEDGQATVRFNGESVVLLVGRAAEDRRRGQ
jgi:hypothetical protein